ncbi:MAG: hypothetical protein Q8M92_10500 [Candidatus Subteraquimicrobiales bacterium]|nr:hypothetical protein [Candidatus Subteraquimicrobiales bacterium]
METPKARYRRISYLFIILGIAIVLISTQLLLSRGIKTEAYAQLLFIPILFGALYYGWKGGLIAAGVSAALYIGVIFFQVESEIVQSAAFSTALRLGFFVFLGVVGGLLFERYREEIKIAEEKVLLDPTTGLFTCRFFITCLREELDRARRYTNNFSIACFNLSDCLETLKGLTRRETLKGIADIFKKEIRIVDLIGRVDVLEIGTLLPETDKKGAKVFTDRLNSRIATFLAEHGVVCEEDIEGKIYTFPDDEEAIEGLISECSAKIEVSHIKRPTEILKEKREKESK